MEDYLPPILVQEFMHDIRKELDEIFSVLFENPSPPRPEFFLGFDISSKIICDLIRLGEIESVGANIFLYIINRVYTLSYVTSDLYLQRVLRQRLYKFQSQFEDTIKICHKYKTIPFVRYYLGCLYWIYYLMNYNEEHYKLAVEYYNSLNTYAYGHHYKWIYFSQTRLRLDHGLINSSPITSDRAQLIIFTLHSPSLITESEGSYLLGRIYLTNSKMYSVDLAIKNFKNAVKGNYPEAYYELGCIYMNGLCINPDMAQAFSCFSQGIMLQNANSFYGMGVLYQNGLYVKTDHTIGFSNILEAVRRGSPHAIARIGLMYLKGIWFRQDISKSAKHFKSTPYCPDSVYGKGLMYRFGYGKKINFSKALSYFCKGMNYGWIDSTYNYAEMLEFGLGIEPDITKALQLYLSIRSLSSGSLDRLYYYIDLEQNMKSEIKKWLMDQTGPIDTVPTLKKLFQMIENSSVRENIRPNDGIITKWIIETYNIAWKRRSIYGFEFDRTEFEEKNIAIMINELKKN